MSHARSFARTLSPDAVTTPTGGRKEDHPFRDPNSPLLTKGTAVSTNNSTRIKLEPGLIKRGNRYTIRVGFRDAEGRRREMSRTLTSKREAKAALIDARAAAQHHRIVPSPRNLTVARFLGDHFLPFIDDDWVRANHLHENTALKYRSYAETKVIPTIGHLRVAEVTSGSIERMLNGLRVGGRHPGAGRGRPRTRPDFVYDLIRAKRQDGWSHSDIALWLASRYPVECAGLTKDAVAAIWRRDHQRGGASAAVQPGLEVSMVKKIHTMLRSAWRFGVRHELIPPDRAHVIAEARSPVRAKGDRKREVVCWTPAEYPRFIDWAVVHRPDLWVAFYFVATSGDRVSANLGLRWSDIGLDAGTANLVNFVKYHGRPGNRVLVQNHGKATAGHQIFLDPRTVTILRDWKARQSERLLSRSDRHTCPTEDRGCPLPGYHDRGLVFPQKDGNYRDPNKFLPRFQDAIRAYNRDNPTDPLPVIHVHALRHGWSTIADNEGVSETIRMNRLDQSSPVVNRRYTHAQQAAMRAAAQVVSDAMFAGSTELGELGASSRSTSMP
jgi:integrase